MALLPKEPKIIRAKAYTTGATLMSFQHSIAFLSNTVSIFPGIYIRVTNQQNNRTKQFFVHALELAKSLMVASIVAFSASSFAHALTLEDALNAAIQTNPTVGEAIENRRSAEYDVESAKGRFLPSVGFSTRTGYQRHDSRRPSSGTNKRITKGSSFGADVTLTQPIFDGFATRSQVAVENAELQSATQQVKLQTISVGLQAIQSYMQVLQERELTALAEENVLQHQKVVNLVERQVEAGSASLGDLQTAIFRLASSQNGLAQAQSRLRDARAVFKRATGIMPGSMVRPIVPRHLLPRTLQAAISKSITNSPAIEAAKARVESSRKAVAVSKAGNYPQVNLQLEGGADRNQSSSPVSTETDVSGILSMSYNIFDGGQTQNQQRSLISALAAERQRYNAAVRDAEQEVRRSWASLISAREAVISAQREATAYAKVRDILQTQFERGTSTVVDILQAESQLNQSQVNFITAVYNEMFTSYRVLNSAGILLDGLNIAQPDIPSHQVAPVQTHASLIVPAYKLSQGNPAQLSNASGSAQGFAISNAGYASQKRNAQIAFAQPTQYQQRQSAPSTQQSQNLTYQVGSTNQAKPTNQASQNNTGQNTQQYNQQVSSNYPTIKQAAQLPDVMLNKQGNNPTTQQTAGFESIQEVPSVGFFPDVEPVERVLGQPLSAIGGQNRQITPLILPEKQFGGLKLPDTYKLVQPAS